jgi:hypothetical protein
MKTAQARSPWRPDKALGRLWSGDIASAFASVDKLMDLSNFMQNQLPAYRLADLPMR